MGAAAASNMLEETFNNNLKVITREKSSDERRKCSMYEIYKISSKSQFRYIYL